MAPEFFLCGDVRAFTGISWYYNWGDHPIHEDHPECEGGEAPPGFVPMIWGYWGQQFPQLEFDTVLGFNEPNHADQANMDPEVAAYAWLRLQEAYPEKTLVSPSASPPHTEEWFDQFFEVCDVIGCRVDYLATHAYTGNADVDIGILNGLYQRYDNLSKHCKYASNCSGTKRKFGSLNLQNPQHETLRLNSTI